MELKKITVLTQVQQTKVNDVALAAGVKPENYVCIVVETKEFGKLRHNLFEISDPETFKQIKNAINGLDWYDFPRIVWVKINFLAGTVEVPPYYYNPTKP